MTISAPVDPFCRDVHCILGLPFDAMDLQMAEAAIRDAVANRRRMMVSTPNLNFVIGCQSDPDFRDSVIGSDLVLVDGMPLVWIARLLRIPIPSRVAGSDLFDCLRRSKQSPLSVYFFGGPEGAAEAACQKLNQENRGLRCAGYHYPGFSSVETMSSEDILHDINASRADFLVVSLGAKKGQAWIMRNRSRLHVPVISHLGAVVNFAAGTVRRAPIWAQHGGLEWLWRIKEEPALWRRYAADGLAFAKLLITKLVPNALIVRLRALRNRRWGAGSASVVDAGPQDSQTLSISGEFVHRTIGAIRPAFALAWKNNRNIIVDLSRVTNIDSAGIAFLMLLQNHQANQNLAFSIAETPHNIRRLVKLNGATQLLSAIKTN